MQITEVKVNLFLLTKMIKPAPLLTETKRVCIKIESRRPGVYLSPTLIRGPVFNRKKYGKNFVVRIVTNSDTEENAD